ncbi:MAG TPA: type 4a pilus biogenesis protein PilO [Frankiaceae bacterium]|nr:type 4a pilus biogenesis protein PilO [Frankiaceae bacterium]
MTKLRQLWLLTALGTLAVIVGGYFMLVSPQSTKASELRTEAQEQVQVNAQLQSQIDQLNKQKKDLPKQQADLARFANLIPSNPAMPALIRSLTDAADNAGVELVTIKPTLPAWAKGVDANRTEVPGKLAAVDGTSLVNIPVTLEIVGRYAEITTFFKEIEDINRALLVGAFRISNPHPDRETDAAYNFLTGEISANVMMTKKAPAETTTPATTSVSDETK